MTIRTTAIALTTAAAIGITSLVPAGPAAAAGFGPMTKAEITTGVAGVEEVGGRHRRHRRHRHRNDAAAAAIIGLGAFALGAAIASQNQPVRCRVRRVQVWDPYRGVYVVRRQRVC